MKHAVRATFLLCTTAVAQAPLYQTNGAGSSLLVDGLAGTATDPARVTIYANTTHTFDLGTSLSNALALLVLAPGRTYDSGTLPGFATAGGQAVNIDAFAAGTGYGYVGLHPGTVSLSVVGPSTLLPWTFSGQQIVFDATAADGYHLSQPVELVFEPNLVDLANAYLATLSATQLAATAVAHSQTNAAKWSNLPAVPGSSGTTNLRNGVALSVLSTVQRAAWVDLATAALGADGYARFQQIQAADDYLGTLSGGYDGDYQYIGIVGTPSTTAGWLLQIGGHHVAWSLYFNGLERVSTTPYFLGVEPTSFTFNGTAYVPMQTQRDGMYNLVNSLTTAQRATAQLSASFNDVYLGAGQNSTSLFPTGTTGRGILGSALTTAQQDLLTAAMAAWVGDSPEAETYMATYRSELSQTYVAWSGGTTLGSQGHYVRIDGPSVWIELCCQGGVVVQGQIHYHTIWRDRTSDYNHAFGF
ncbi:MAG: DUF3500 domain-containing protein [Planctomycetes bacterium]|nr:DUF3500 domain-containing protein [Planctomycetota bacterium]